MDNKKKLKKQILHINCNYTGTTLHQLMIEKLEENYEHINSVFVPVYDKNVSTIKPNENVIVSECFKKWDRIIFDYKQRKILKSIEKIYNVKDFSLIHAYTLFTDGNCARTLSKKYNIPYVVAVRNTDVNSFLKLKPYLKNRGIKTMLNAKAVFFLSESYRKQVFDKYVPKKYKEILMQKSHIIPNGIDDFWFNNSCDEIKTLNGHIKLIYAGRIDKNKNILSIQKAMEVLRGKGYSLSLTVVGKIVDKKLFEEIEKNNYTEYVKPQQKEGLLELYRKHDIFIMPSHTESFGLVYVEAMTQGLPVIYSKGQGFDNQFPEGKVGYHVDSNDVLSIANGMEELIKNYNSTVPNVVDCSKVFNWKDIVYKYNKIYEDILNP